MNEIKFRYIGQLHRTIVNSLAGIRRDEKYKLSYEEDGVRIKSIVSGEELGEKISELDCIGCVGVIEGPIKRKLGKT